MMFAPSLLIGTLDTAACARLLQTGLSFAQRATKPSVCNLTCTWVDQMLADLLFMKVHKHATHGHLEPSAVHPVFRLYVTDASAGQQEEHLDNRQTSKLTRSKVSLLLYLNDDFEGGLTSFNGYSAVKPVQGAALLFDQQLRHHGTAVTSGVKVVVRSDIMYPREDV